MKAKLNLILTIFIVATCSSYGQNNLKIAHYFSDQIAIDSASIIIIPTIYNVALFSSSKFSFSDDYYANIIFYNSKTDSSKKLFENDTYILSFNAGNYSTYNSNKLKGKNINPHYVFYRVKNIDHNKNGHIDGKDPSILYVSDVHGNNLRSLTTEDENVVAVNIYESQNFALIKIQRDFDKNGNFESEDKDFYFVRLDLTTLKFGNKIEAK